MKAVFLDTESLDDLSFAPIEQHCSHLALYGTTTPELVAERIADAELVLLNKVRINRQHLEDAPSVKLICVVATGTDVVDLQAASELGVTVCNCQNYGTASVVQHVISLLLALATRLIPYHKAVLAGRWQESAQFCFLDYPITELAGKKLGIVGYGTLGKAVGQLAEALGMEVIVARRPGAEDDTRPPLSELLPELDALTLHCPLTPATRNLIDADALAMMKPGALLINCARGGLIDETALATALRENRLGGAATDVLSTEPPRDGNPLLAGDIPNLIVTPHIAWGSVEARNRIIVQTAENIDAYLQGIPVRMVNKPGKQHESS